MSEVTKPADAVGTTFLGAQSVARVGLGAMQLPRLDRLSATRLIRQAVELCVNHADTAAYYGPGTANEFIKAALYPYPEDLVIVNDVGHRRSERGGLQILDLCRACNYADSSPAARRSA